MTQSSPPCYRTLLLTIVVASLTTPIARGQNGVWIGGGMTPSWDDPSNWMSGVIPGPAGTADFMDGAASTLVEINLPTTVGLLLFTNGLFDYQFQLNLEGTSFMAQELHVMGPGSVTFQKPIAIGSSTAQFDSVNLFNGTTRIGAGMRLLVNGPAGTAIQPDATLSLLDDPNVGTVAELESPNVMSFGSIRGIGTITGTLNNSGFVMPGSELPTDSPGLLTVTGDYLQDTSGTLELNVNGSELFDQLFVGNDGNFDGRLTILAAPGSPEPNDALISGEGNLLPGRFRPVETIGDPDFFYAPDFQTMNSFDVFGNVFQEGDMDLNTVVEPADVEWFVTALRNRDTYWMQRGIEGSESGDIDDDNDLDFDDIDDFATLVGLPMGAVLNLIAGVPEPSTALLLLTSLTALGTTRFRG